MKTKRIFIAIKIDNTDQINELFRQVGFDLNEEIIKWVDKDGLHITLLFLGEKNVEEIDGIANKLKSIETMFAAFPIKLKSLAAFPSMDYPKIIWAGVHSTPILFQLQKEILNVLHENKIADDYKYTPHLTIGRIKGGVKNPERAKKCLLKYKNWQDSSLLITEFVLMESVLTQQGPNYIVLKNFSLR